ncbi:MAG: hypothetical protein P1V36_10870 [Planctomycetota bacterium]|nr:hypothetical protein [Planctomycetota bacterium]
MAELNIHWQTVEKISSKASKDVVVTGEGSDTTKKVESDTLTLKWGTKPVVVYVCDEAAGCEGFDKLEEVVLKDEKVALGMKGFKTVKMHPDHAELDPLLAGKGKELPRMLLVDPVKMKVKVLEKGKLKASTLYSAMKQVSGTVYKEKLDKVVKTHLKLLTEQDQLANAKKVLDGKASRLASEDGKKAEKDLAEVKKDRAEVDAKLAELKKQVKALWTLTPKSEKKTA